MSKLADWSLRGPVHSLRIEQASWDADGQAWKPVRHFTVVTFRGDGRATEVVTHNPNGSIARQAWVYDDSGRLLEKRSGMNDDAPTRMLYDYDAEGRVVRALQVTPDDSHREMERSTYDAAGWRTTVMVLPEPPSMAGELSMSYGVEGSRASYGAPGATTLTMEYDARELPTTGTFRDADGRVVLCVTFTRDDAGRVLSEEARMGQPSFLVNSPPGEPLPEEVRAELTAVALVAFPDNVFAASSQTYDAAGRLVERTERFGALSEDRTTYHYGDHGDVAEETTSGWRQSNSSDDGVVDRGELEVSEHHVRYEYRHDHYGNWTQRILFSRSALDAPFSRSQIERREIRYDGINGNDGREEGA